MLDIGQIFDGLVLPLKLAVLSVLSSRKISVLDKQLPDLLRQILLEQKFNIKDTRRYFDEESAINWLDEIKFLINMLISTSMIDVKKSHQVPLAQILSEIVKWDQFQIALELKNNMRDQNSFYSYRVVQTPTLNII